jgi:cAMP phosphodiesterase
MKVQIITSMSPGSNGVSTLSRQFTASYVVNDCLAIDAGAIGWMNSLDMQSAIGDVLLSHPHLDHIASLPMFLDNVYGVRPDGVRIWTSEHTERALREHCFNGVMWPDLTSLSPDAAKHMQFRRFRGEEPFPIGDLAITPLTLDHVGPTFGFLVDDGASAFAIISDTREVDRVWDLLNAAPRLNTVFLECSFPNRMRWLADVSKHLTPESFGRQLSRLQRKARVVAIHIKAAFADETSAELVDLALDDFELGRPGQVFDVC